MNILSRKAKVIIFCALIIIITITIAILIKSDIKETIAQEEINKLALEEQEKIKIEVDIKEETTTAYKCLLIFTSNDENNKIKSIEYPEQEGQEPNIIQIEEEDGRQKVALDYELQKDDIEKKFKVKTKHNEIIIKRTAYNISLHYNDEENTIKKKNS